MKRIYLILVLCTLTFSSVFAAISFRVLQIDPNGGTNTMPAHNLIYDVAESFVITPPVRDGYTFAGWEGDGVNYISRSGFEGSSGEELTFNGATYYALPTSLKYTDKITVNLWAYMSNWGDYATGSMRMISCTETGGWGIEPNTEGKIQFTMRDDTANKYQKVTSSTLWSDLSSGWHMFTMTFDGRNMYGYVDGKMHGATDIFKGKIAYNSGNAILLGAEATATSTPTGGYFTGKIKDVTIVNASMTSTAVSNLYSAVSSTKGDVASVVRYYVPDANKTLKATWTANPESTTPTISVNTKTLNFETTEGTTAANQTITVSAAKLTGNITATLGGADASSFSITPASLSSTGGTITVSYKATAVGSHSATLTLSATGATNQVVNLKGVVNAKGTTPDTGLSGGTVSVNKSSITLEGTYDDTNAPFVEFVVTNTSTSPISVNPNTSAVTATTLSDWDAQAGGTVRVTLNTSMSPDTYTGYVAVQSGAATNRVEIPVTAIIHPAGGSTEPNPETPTYDFTATPTLTKVWETSNVLASANARYGTGYNGKVYAVDADSKTLYSWDSEGCQKAQVATSIGGGWACVMDDAGNLLTNTDKWGANGINTFTGWQIYDVDAKKKTALTVSVPSGLTTGYIYANVAVAGDLMSATGGTIYMAPAGQKVAAKVVVKNGTEVSSTKAAASTINFTNEDQVAVANVEYSALTDESFIWRGRLDAGNTNYMSNGVLKTYAEPATENRNTGFATFKLGSVEYGICPTGTNKADGFSVYTLSDGVVAGARTESKTGTDQHASFRAEKVSDGEVNIYFYKAGVSCGMYKFAYPLSNTGGVTTDKTVTEDALFGYYTSGETLHVTGVVAQTIDLYSITGQKVCTVNHTNEMSVANLQGVYIVAVTDANNVMYTGKIIVK